MESIANHYTKAIASIINAIISHISALWRDKKKMQFEQDEQIFRDRPELKLVSASSDIKKYDEVSKSKICDVDIIVARIKNVNITDESFFVEYEESIINKKDWVYRAFKLENAGKSPIYDVSFIALLKKTTSVFNIKHIQENIVRDGYLNYSVLIEKRIDPGETINFRLVYTKDNIISNIFSAPFVICLHGEKGTYWEQPFFDEDKKIYEARKISYQEYRELANSENAIECFEKPWLW